MQTANEDLPKFRYFTWSGPLVRHWVNIMAAQILIVHDQKAQQEQMKDALSVAHEVSIASDAHEAMIVLKQLENLNLDRPPLDLIVSCVHIEATEDMTVFDLLKWSRGNPQMCKVPFVLICSEPSSMAKSLIDSVRLAGSALGASGYMIMESFDAATFLAQIEYYLPKELRSLSRHEEELVEKVLEAAPDVGQRTDVQPVTESEAVAFRRTIIANAKPETHIADSSGAPRKQANT